jgi:A/G-specific adenine glycosylase
LLGGMLALPTTDWRAKPWTDAEVRAVAPLSGSWIDAGAIDHVFTHFSLDLAVRRIEASALDGAIWTPRAGLDAMPSVFLKAARLGLGGS